MNCFRTTPSLKDYFTCLLAVKSYNGPTATRLLFLLYAKKNKKKNADKVYACINAEAYCLVYLQAGCCIVTMREYEGESVFCPTER